jgi:hypothetical protein
MPANTYYAKKLTNSLTMDVEKIHACRNHGILYRRDDYKDLEAAQSVVQVGTRQIKTIKRKNVLHLCLKRRSKSNPNRRLQNPVAKKKK